MKHNPGNLTYNSKQTKGGFFEILLFKFILFGSIGVEIIISLLQYYQKFINMTSGKKIAKILIKYELNLA